MKTFNEFITESKDSFQYHLGKLHKTAKSISTHKSYGGHAGTKRAEELRDRYDHHLGQIKKNQFLIGFALETENEIENAKSKIQKKNLDVIVLNSLNDEGAGFGKPTNKVTFIDKEFNIFDIPLKSKELVAEDIVNLIVKKYAN